MNTPIVFRFVDSPAGSGRCSTYKTLAGAQRAAQRLVGSKPKRDHDGYAVHRVTGNCLFFQGVTFEQLFPAADPQTQVLDQGKP